MSTPPRPHHLAAPTVDTLPCGVDVEVAGGLVDLYLDVNKPEYQRIRLDATNALRLYRQLGERITRLPIRIRETDQWT